MTSKLICIITNDFYLKYEAKVYLFPRNDFIYRGSAIVSFIIVSRTLKHRGSSVVLIMKSHDKILE